MDTRDKQKYVEVPAFVEGYHEPEPPKTRSWDIFSVDDYKDLDERVKHIPKDKQCDFPTLVRHLTDGLTTDVQKVRAIFSWMGEQNHQDVKYHKKTYRYSPNGYLKHMKETMSSKLYSTLFAILCREAGLQCVNLTGICKAGNYEVGDADISQNISHWNAVYIEGSWRFVHCFWAFTALFGSNTGGWLKVEHKGKQVRENIQQSKGEAWTMAPDDDYFFIEPEQLNMLCRSENEQWQLLQKSFTIKTFLECPYIEPEFSQCGFTFKGRQSGVLETRLGQCKVTILSKLNHGLTYELFYKTDQERQFPEATSADRYVILENKNDEDEINFTLNLPKTGQYRLRLMKDVISSRLCDFKIVCNETLANYRPPPRPDINWGPGPAAKTAGITSISHRNGIIPVKRDENMTVHFNVKKGQKIEASLTSETFPLVETKQYVSTTIINQHVQITVRPEIGTYALHIHTAGRKTSERKNILNYVIESGPTNKRLNCGREPTDERIVREHLLEASREGNQEDLIKYMKRFKQLQMGDISVYTKARQSLEILEIKQHLRQAVLRNRTDELYKAIGRAKSSDVAETLTTNIHEAEVVLMKLLQHQANPRKASPVNNRNIAELKAIRHLTVPLRNVLTAVFLLLGEHRWTLQDPQYLLAQLKRHSADELLHRLKVSIDQAPPDAVVEAKRLLDTTPEERLARTCPPAHKIYKEVSSDK
ncbi:hillarin-like [Haliotis rubra]|uniref:hillarin-like n=1 Tax=Haliotis rubra TaxID=36100 RepID=UPI001EE57848|nr:hillarin-like [Haliotis rubra]